jgi:Flp pilus assembly protein TadD
MLVKNMRAHLRYCCLIVTLAFLGACGEPESASQPKTPQLEAGPATFAGSDACIDCHKQQHDEWQGSHHDLAMKGAGADTVLGDFSGTQFTYHAVTSEFTQRDGKYFVSTDNAVGEQQEFEISYTFGLEPLQQYLIEFPDGRLQALPIAWDSRPAEDGGQRWFHLYPDEPISHTDQLHWTGREQNWNYMCAECHSTNLQKNYDLQADTFATTWTDINVSCEGCHGPASRHVQFAQDGTLPSDKGLQVDLDDAGYATWEMDPFSGIASRSESRMRPPIQPEACGRCHSRRSVMTNDYEFGQSLLDTHLPSLLLDPLYYPDGQIRDEVYVYGSFLQSKMYQAGVSCTDCHNPHTARLRSDGAPSNVCSTCHLPTKFASTEHHHHAPADVECVDCHMPTTDYMVVDPRRDHSFRVPRPDLSAVIGMPNACNGCHEDKGAEWAAEATREWYGEPAAGHFAHAMHAARSGDPQANERLLAVANDATVAGIVRATALSLYTSPLSQQQAESVQRALRDADPLVRLAALRSLSVLPPDAALQWAVHLLGDPLLAVRIAAFDALSPAQDTLPAANRAAFENARRDFVGAQMAVAERPEAHGNLASAYAAAGDFAAAESSYLFALEREPRAVALRVNLADLYRQMSREEDAESVLRAGLDIDAANPSLHHSLGLLLVRMQREEEAVTELALAARLAPQVARYTYVHAIALNSTGNTGEAIAVISGAVQSFPANFDIGWAHVTLLRDAGRLDNARAAAAALVLRFPGNENALNLLRSFDTA